MKRFYVVSKKYTGKHHPFLLYGGHMIVVIVMQWKPLVFTMRRI